MADVLIRDYCREPGVRSLEKATKKVTEKIAFRIIKQIEEGKEDIAEVDIALRDLPHILGQPKFSDFKFKVLPPGVVCGLAYTEYGGSTLYLEVTQSRFLPKPAPGQPSKPTRIITYATPSIWVGLASRSLDRWARLCRRACR